MPCVVNVFAFIWYIRKFLHIYGVFYFDKVLRLENLQQQSSTINPSSETSFKLQFQHIVECQAQADDEIVYWTSDSLFERLMTSFFR